MLILLTGEPGSGKSTAIRKIADLLGRRRCRGLLAGEISENGKRMGFSTETLDGRKSIVLAHVDLPKDVCVSRYGVNTEGFNEILRDELDSAVSDESGFLIVDEIGRMQLKCSEFEMMIRRAADSGKTLIATICLDDEYEIIGELKQRDDSTVYVVTEENRETLPLEIVLSLMKDDPVYLSKIEKARKYRTDPARWHHDGDDLILRSTHDVRRITRKNGIWHCTCEYYRETGTCSHIISLLI